MKDLLAWLLGFRSFPRGDVEQVSLEFVYLPAGTGFAFAVGTAAVAVVFAFWIYRKRRETLGWRRWLMMACRALALCMLLFLLLGPVINLVAHDTLQSVVVVLVDDSMSMGLVDKRLDETAVTRTAVALGLTRADTGEQGTGDDGDATPAAVSRGVRDKVEKATRLDVAKAVIGPDGSDLVRKLQERFDVRLFRFHRNLTSMVPDIHGSAKYLGDLTAGGGGTRIGNALHAALDDLRGLPLAGIVVVSDGSSNEGIDPVEATAKAGDRDVPVYFVGIGEENACDLQLAHIEVPEFLFAEDAAPIVVGLRQWGCAGRTVSVTVSDGTGKELVRQAVTLADTEEQHVTLKVTPETEGQFEYIVSVDPMEDELVLDNNLKSRDVRVIDQKIRVLWIDSGPRYEFRYAKNLLKRDTKRFETNILLTESDPGIRGGSSIYIEELPRDARDLFRYNVIVLGDVDPITFSEAAMDTLRRYVAEQGGAVVLLPGRRHALNVWRGTPVEELIPVETGDYRARTMVDELDRPMQRAVYARLTPLGRYQPLLTLSNSPDESAQGWEKFLQIYRPTPCGPVKPGGQVLLETDDAAPQPLIVHARYGAGTVLYVGVDELWRWRYRPGPGTHDRFWGSVFEQMALARLKSGSQRLVLRLSRQEVGLGDEVLVTARLADTDFQPISGPSVTALVTRETDGESETRELSLNAIAEGKGAYEGTFVPRVAGRYTVALVDGDEREVASFRALAPQTEFESPALDKAKLTEWAKRSGGNIYDPWRLGALPDELAAKAKSATVRIEEDMWDAPIWAFLFVLIAGIEWFTRKRMNLP